MNPITKRSELTANETRGAGNANCTRPSSKMAAVGSLVPVPLICSRERECFVERTPFFFEKTNVPVQVHQDLHGNR